MTGVNGSSTPPPGTSVRGQYTHCIEAAIVSFTIFINRVMRIFINRVMRIFINRVMRIFINRVMRIFINRQYLATVHTLILCALV